MKYTVVTLAVLYTAYLAKSLLLPIFIALFLAMSLSPITVRMDALKIPRSISSLLTLSLTVTFVVFIVISISGSLEDWVKQVPEATTNISEQISELSKPIDELTASADDDSKTSEKLIDKVTAALMAVLASGTPVLLAQVLATFVLCYFFLTYGEDILRKIVRIRETQSEKKITVEILRTIQTDISYYLLVILVINLGLGLSVWLTFSVIGIKDPVLWGTLATLLNFTPYLGPLFMALILLGVGLIEYDALLMICMPMLVYMSLNLVEANFVTPAILGKKLKLNPLIVLLWLFLWGWIWGAAGLLLGVPMLVCFKIIAQQLNLFGKWIHLIEEVR